MLISTQVYVDAWCLRNLIVVVGAGSYVLLTLVGGEDSTVPVDDIEKFVMAIYCMSCWFRCVAFWCEYLLCLIAGAIISFGGGECKGGLTMDFCVSCALMIRYEGRVYMSHGRWLSLPGPHDTVDVDVGPSIDPWTYGPSGPDGCWVFG